MYPATDKIAPSSRSFRLLLARARFARLLFGFEVDVGMIYQYRGLSLMLSMNQTVKELFVGQVKIVSDTKFVTI